LHLSPILESIKLQLHQTAAAVFGTYSACG
jgi:hypothetical protein